VHPSRFARFGKACRNRIQRRSSNLSRKKFVHDADQGNVTTREGRIPIRFILQGRERFSAFMGNATAKGGIRMREEIAFRAEPHQR
jgi:hypothetical protein